MKTRWTSDLWSPDGSTSTTL